MEANKVRDRDQRIYRVLDRVRTGKEVLILGRGKAASGLAKPSSESVAFLCRQGLRAELPAMRLWSGETVRDLRNAERY